MDWQEDYKRKLCSPQDAAALVKSGDLVHTGTPPHAPAHCRRHSRPAGMTSSILTSRMCGARIRSRIPRQCELRQIFRDGRNPHRHGSHRGPRQKAHRLLPPSSSPPGSSPPLTSTKTCARQMSSSAPYRLQTITATAASAQIFGTNPPSANSPVPFSPR